MDQPTAPAAAMPDSVKVVKCDREVTAGVDDAVRVSVQYSFEGEDRGITLQIQGERHFVAVRADEPR